MPQREGDRGDRGEQGTTLQRLRATRTNGAGPVEDVRKPGSGDATDGTWVELLGEGSEDTRVIVREESRQDHPGYMDAWIRKIKPT